MSRGRSPADAYPATIVVAIAYGTLAVLTRMFGEPEEFHDLLLQHGMLTPALVADGDWWRLLAAAFLHGGAVHLVFNLMVLWSLGPAIEQSLGSLRFAALYVVAGVGGNIAVCLLYDPRQPVLGGSGALFGMMGAAVALNMRSGRHAFAFLDFEGPRRLLGTIVANLVIGFLLPFVSNTAHVGGLLAGFAVTWLWLRPGRLPSPGLRRWRLAVGALALVLLGWSGYPVTRADWLAGAVGRTADPGRVRQLTEAFMAAVGDGPRDRPRPRGR
jgi:membrane associated rhomboid family serine protease